MIKIKNKKALKKSLIITAAVTAPLVAGLGATLFAIHSKEAVNVSTVYDNLVEGETLFRLYSPYIEVSKDDKQKVVDSYKQARADWNSPDKTLQEKLISLDKAQQIALNFYIQTIDNQNFQKNDPAIFWNKILTNQENRIRELDLKEQLTQLKEDHSVKFFAELHTLSSEEKVNYLNSIANEVSKLVVNQNELINPFIELMQQASQKADQIPFDGLKNDLVESLSPLYSRIINANFRLNEVEIASQTTIKEQNKLDEILTSSQSEINEINEYLNLIVPHINNAAFTNEQKQRVQEFVNTTKNNLSQALTKADLNQIRNAVVTFYQQISDSQKSVSEIKQVVSQLHEYINEFDDSLVSYKNNLNTQVDQVLTISDHNQLILAKAKLFSNYYSVKYANTLIEELKLKANEYYNNNLISNNKVVVIKSNLDTLVNKKLSPTELASQVYKFYNSQINELETLEVINKELQLLQAQSDEVANLKFTTDEIKNKLSKLSTQIAKTYSNDVSTAYLLPIKKELNESLRLIFKDNLKQLISQMDDFIKELTQVNDPENTKIVNEAQALNQESLPMVRDFDPVPTADLIAQIKKYNFRLQNLINAKKQSQAEELSNFTDNYLGVLFGGDDPSYVPTKKEQARIDLYNNYKNRLDELRDLINNGNGDPAVADEIAFLTDKLKKLTDTGNKFRELSNLEKQAQETNDRVKNGPHSTILKPYTDKIDSIRSELDALYANPDATNEQIQDAIDRLNQAIKDLEHSEIENLLNEKIKNLKSKIDQYYPNDKTSPGAQALLKEYEQLLNETKNTDNLNQTNDLVNRVDKLNDLVGPVFDLEVQKQKLRDIIGEKNSAKYKGNKTENAIVNANEEIEYADKLIADLNSPETIPNTAAFESEKTQLYNRGEEILLAYEQDRIEKLNQQIQATSVEGEATTLDNYRGTLSRVNSFASLRKNEADFDVAKAAGDKLEKLANLAQASHDLLELFNVYNDEVHATIAGYITNKLQEHNILVSDEDDRIDAKVEALKEAKRVVDAKKKFLDTYNSLAGILSENKNWKIYQDLNEQITLIQEKRNSVLYDDELTVDQINARRIELIADIEAFTREKERLLNEYNQAIVDTDAKESTLDQEVAKLKELNPNYNFDNYYARTKTAYAADKTDANKPVAGIEEILAYQTKLEVAFYKDIVLNKLKDLETFASSDSFGVSELHNQIKTWQKSFDSEYKLLLQNDDLTLTKVKEMSNNVDKFFTLFDLQKRSADYIATLEGDETKKTLQAESINALKAAIAASEPVAENEYSDLQIKTDDLQEVYNREVEIEQLRHDIVQSLENDDLTKGEYGLLRIFENKFGSNYDEQAWTNLQTLVTSIKNQTQEATTKNTLINLQKRVAKIKEHSSEIADLAKEVFKANSTIGSLINTDSAVVKKYQQDLNNFVSTARNNYYLYLDSTRYNNLLNQLKYTNLKLANTDTLVTKLKEIRQIITSDTFDFRSLNGVDGSTKLLQLQNYLNSFETAASNNTYTQDAADAVTSLIAKANDLKNVVDLDSEISKLANQIAQRNSAVDAADLKILIKLMWNSVPTRATDSDSILGKRPDNLYNVSDLFNLNAITKENYHQIAEKMLAEMSIIKNKVQDRNEYRRITDEKLQNLKAKEYTPVVHNSLKRALNALLDQLIEQNNNASVKTDSPDESGELNVLRSKTVVIETKFEALKELATRAYNLEILTNRISSDEESVTTAKAKSLEMVTKAETYFDDVEKMMLNGEESVENLTTQLTEQYFRLSLLFNYQKVKTKFDNDRVMLPAERAVVQQKFDQFWSDFNSGTISVENIFNKYFIDYHELTNEQLNTSEYDHLLDLFLDKTVELRRIIQEGTNIIALKDENIDDTLVNQAMTQLQQEVTQAIADNVNTTIVARAKMAKITSLREKIDATISAKKEQLNRQLAKDNTLKDHIYQTADVYGTNGTVTYVNNFQTNAIDRLQSAYADKDNLSYSEINVFLSEAISVYKGQIFELYNISRTKAENVDLALTDYVDDFSETQTSARGGANITGDNTSKYDELKTIKDQISTALSADFTTEENYYSKLNPLNLIIKSSWQSKINALVSAIKSEFIQKFNPKPEAESETDKPGFYVNLLEKFDALKNNLDGKTVNVFTYNEIESLESSYDSLRSEIEQVQENYSVVIERKDATSLANYAARLYDLNQSYLRFQTQVQTVVNDALDKNPLEEVFLDIFGDLRYSTESQYTQALKTKFEAFKATIVQKANTLTVDDNTTFDFEVLNQNSDKPQVLSDLINLLTSYKDWINQTENKQLLLEQIDATVSKSNPLPPIVDGVDGTNGTFDKKYKIVIPKTEYTRKKFLSNFEEFSNQATASNSDLVEIGNNDNFLDMFDQFAFTKKDIKDTGDLESIFSPITVKVFIKKYDENGWFQLINSGRDDVDRKSLKAKVVYSYISGNTNIGELSVEREVVLTFKTIDTLRIENGTTSIFINENGQVGYNTKYEALDVDEAGWNIPVVTDSTPQEEKNRIINEVVTRTYNKMKEAIFALDETNATLGGSNAITMPNATFGDTVRTSTEAKYQNISYNTDESNAGAKRLSAFLNNDNKNSFAMYGFDFQNQDSLAVTYNVSLSSLKRDEYLRIIADDSTKGFSFVQLSGGYITGLPTYGVDKFVDYVPEVYDFRIHSAQYNAYNGLTEWWTTTNEQNPSGINLNLYSFNIDYDPISRKVYIYNSWVENVFFLINKTNIVTSLSRLKTNSQFREDDKAFLSSLETKVRGNSSPITPIELSRYYSLVSSLNNRIYIVSTQGGTYQLPSGSSSSYGSYPIWPINGGQQTVWRSNSSDPKTASLKPTPSTDFPNPSNNARELVKESARQALYAAVVEKFWFKIRKSNSN
ncbi:hypothetical protein [Mycoplasmopsis columboralis]|uniref:Uncharacterized protein n=1 Tax=Mycoplasmopsis columboralis TaxID=171282 RepID=A0A449B5M8_9BACT|nr:hypothetical protein [Mycoplasmopsis columboralis]VEU75910.1 Uncharacterised protein [Mycoplasmopsis columboralis]